MSKNEVKTTYPNVSSFWRVCDIPERLRPREEADRVGIENVSDDVLLSILIRSGTKGISVVDLSRMLIDKYGSLSALASASVDELAMIKGLGRVKAQVLVAATELAKRLNKEVTPEALQIRTPSDVVSVLGPDSRRLDHEVFWVLMLDSKNRVKGSPVKVSTGLLDSSLVHAREVFREAIKLTSAAVILAHNHPSGDTVASAEDIKITRRLIDAGKIIGIKVLDHVILGNDGHSSLSMRNEGLLSFS